MPLLKILFAEINTDNDSEVRALAKLLREAFAPGYVVKFPTPAVAPGEIRHVFEKQVEFEQIDKTQAPAQPIERPKHGGHFVEPIHASAVSCEAVPVDLSYKKTSTAANPATNAGLDQVLKELSTAAEDIDKGTAVVSAGPGKVQALRNPGRPKSRDLGRFEDASQLDGEARRAKIEKFLEKVGHATGAEICNALNLPRGSIVRLMDDPRFTRTEDGNYRVD